MKAIVYRGHSGPEVAFAERKSMAHNDPADVAAYEKAAELLGKPLELPLGVGEPQSGDDLRRLATRHAFGDSWSRPGLDQRSRALISVAIISRRTPERQEPSTAIKLR